MFNIIKHYFVLNNLCKISKYLYRLFLVWILLTAFPWLEKQCFGDGETSFSVCCKIWAPFPEKMPKSSSLGFKGFSGNTEVSNLKQARGRRKPRRCTEIFFHENYKRCSVGANGRLYERDHTRNARPSSKLNLLHVT